jgi:hypothetical protein
MDDFQSVSFKAVKPKSNVALNFALTICFSGLFLMLVGAACFGVVLAGGGKAVVSNLTFLVMVALYLGLIVIALVAAGFTLQLPDWKNPLPIPLRVPRKVAVVNPERNLGREFVNRALIFDRRVRGFVVRSASSALIRLNETSPLSALSEGRPKLVKQPVVAGRSRRKKSR